MKTQRYYQIRSIVRFVFWTTAAIIIMVTLAVIGNTFTEWYYGIDLP